MYLKFNPLNRLYKSVRGGVKENTPFRICVLSDAENVTLEIFCASAPACDCAGEARGVKTASGDAGSFSVLPADSRGINEKSGKNKEDGFLFFTEASDVRAENIKIFEFFIELKRGLYYYRFNADGVLFGAGNELDAIEETDRNTSKSWQLTVYPADYSVPEWIKGGVIYQIFPDRFCKKGDFSVGKDKQKRADWGGEPKFRDADGVVRNNEFFGGNFEGIISKLGYIKSLGVTVIYLNPIFTAYSSHRYDTGDYMSVDDVLGGDEAFFRFLKACEKEDIKVIIDGVFNHVGAGSRYFNKYGDYGEKSGAYRDKNSPYYEWFVFRNYPDDYESWWGFKNLPSINKNCNSFQNFIAGDGGVLEKYLKAGVYGVRLDVADELTDEFILKIKSKLDSFGDRLLIGEVWEDATSKIAYGVRRAYFTGGELHSVMNYPLKDAIIDYVKTGKSELLASTVREQINNYPLPALNALMNSLSTHDTVRIINALGRNKPIENKADMADNYLTEAEYEKGKKLLKLCAVLQYFLYGVPSLYYGDEEGLQGDLDPYNRRCFNWENIDNGLIALFSALAAVRRDLPVFKDGKCETIIADGGLFGFSRSIKNLGIAVFVNTDWYTHTVTLSRGALELDIFGQVKEKAFSARERDDLGTDFEIPPESFKVLAF